MAEPTASNYPAALDNDTTLFGDAIELSQFTLDAGISNSATTISVSESIASVNTPCYILIDSEIIHVGSKSGGDFATCTRGARSTSAVAHDSGDVAYVVFSSNHYNQLKRALVAIETELGIAPSGASADLVTRLGAATAAEFGRLVGVTSAIQTQLDAKAALAGPTFTGTVTLPKTTEIQDTSANHQYVLAVSELSADRTVTLPLLTGNDTFVFADFVQTLTGKTLQLPETGGILLDAALSGDGTYSGICETGTAGTALAFGDLVYLAVADSRWELADADAAATAGPVKLGICVQVAAGDGSATTILLFGKVRADAVFPALTIGAPVYVGTTAGDIVVTAPSGSADIVRIVGYANTADELFFCPDKSFIELA